MHDSILTPQTALKGLINAGRYGRQEGDVGIRISEVKNFSLANITAFKNCREPLEKVIDEYLGLDLPIGPQRIEKNGYALIGHGPDQWLAIGYEENSAGIFDKLEKASRDYAAIVDQSDARAIIRLSGPDARKALAKGVSIDLDPSVFHTNCTATTFAAGLWINLWQINDSPAYEISVFRGFGASLASWIKNSAEEFGYINQ